MLGSQHWLNYLMIGCTASREKQRCYEMKMEIEKVRWCIIKWIGTTMSEARGLI